MRRSVRKRFHEVAGMRSNMMQTLFSRSQCKWELGNIATVSPQSLSDSHNPNRAVRKLERAAPCIADPRTLLCFGPHVCV